jgi:hypothetical protein
LLIFRFSACGHATTLSSSALETTRPLNNNAALHTLSPSHSHPSVQSIMTPIPSISQLPDSSVPPPHRGWDRVSVRKYNGMSQYCSARTKSPCAESLGIVVDPHSRIDQFFNKNHLEKKPSCCKCFWRQICPWRSAWSHVLCPYCYGLRSYDLDQFEISIVFVAGGLRPPDPSK